VNDRGAGNSRERMPRARRFALQFPIQFRAGHDASWRTGRVVNISWTGVLFVAESHPLDFRAPFEARFLIPTHVPGASPASVRCWGHIVRLTTADEEQLMAATIETYALQPVPRSV